MNIYVFLYFFPVFTLLTIVEASRPTIGVIRWDAWNQFENQYDPISYYLHRALSPEHFHYRIPFYAQSISPSNISFNGDDQKVMDAEILFANHAGIDYWAFDTYCTFGANCSTTNPFCEQYYQQTSNRYCPRYPSYGLELYLNSTYRRLMNFTLLLLGSPSCDVDFQKQYIELMKHEQYHTVLGRRPLIYLFQFSDAEAESCGGGWSGSGKVFDRFRQMIMNEGLANPYMVLMDFTISTVQSHARLLGFDSISTYALPGGTIEGTPFVELAQTAEAWWHGARQTESKMVPIVPTGWDPRPRAENPVPWVIEGPQHYVQPNGDELQNLIQRAINFTCQYNETVEAQTIIIYAWNECSETSGSLIPSYGNGTLYIDALSKILPMHC